MQNNLFKLGFIHLEDLIFHETCDFNRVRRLAEQIKKDGHLKNPILVSGSPVKPEPADSISKTSEKLLVLDGVNRVSALKLLGYPDVLAQQVNYMDPHVDLTSWDHLIFNFEKQALIERLETENLEIANFDGEFQSAKDEQLTAEDNMVCLIIFRDRSAVMIKQQDSALEGKVKSLLRIIAIYNTSWEIYPHLGDDSLVTAFDTLENCSAVNILPGFKKEEVIELASKGILFPFGVTRFVIPQRILGLGISCSVLGAKVPLSEKNLFLKELMSYRVKSKKARFYEKSVFLFNE
jgi:hypothetical protein